MAYPISSPYSAYNNILLSREDMYSYVFHFTKGADAIDVFKQIMLERRLIRGEVHPICFTETPVYMLSDMFDLYSQYPEPYLAPYGIGFKKDFIFKKGGRHVIYGMENERELLDESIRWRFERYEPGIRDYTWLREWRLNLPELPFDSGNCIIVTKSEDENFAFTQEEGELEQFIIDYVKDGQYIIEPVEAKLPIRHYKGISMELIKDLNMNKVDFNEFLSWQEINDEEGDDSFI